MGRNNIFNTIQSTNPKSNFFDLSHDVKYSFNMGQIIPILALDCVPGDKFNISTENMLRFGALLAPIMHRVKVTTHFFFVPNRIIWDNWEDWIGGNIEVEPPYITPPVIEGVLTVNQGSVADYMGIPTVSSPGAYAAKISAFPFAAYCKIWYDYYRDQNNMTLEFSDTVKDCTELNDGDCNSLGSAGFQPFNELVFTATPLSRAYEHDYFTSALPFAQKGDEVMLPLGDFNDVNLRWTGNPIPQPVGDLLRNTDGSVFAPGSAQTLSAAATTGLLQAAGVVKYLDNSRAMVAETSELTAGAASINNLRRAFRLQEWLEKNARGGTRYVELMLVHFGVRSKDARLQRPEYLGGSVQNMVISEVLSTAQTVSAEGDVLNPVGAMSGHGISVGGSRSVRHYCEEHGWIIGLISVMPQTAYQQGIPKKFSRYDRYEYYWPSFAHIGEQAIQQQEVYYDPAESEAVNLGTFGYIPRYAEYRFENSRVAGQFRDQLDFWHLGRKFENAPALNEEFIYPVTSDFDRIFAVETSIVDSIYAHTLNRVKVTRKMPRYGTPML